MDYKTQLMLKTYFNTCDKEGIPEKDVENFFQRDGTLNIITSDKKVTIKLWKNSKNSSEKIGQKNLPIF